MFSVRSRPAAVATAVVVAALLAACGSDDAGTDAAPPQATDVAPRPTEVAATFEGVGVAPHFPAFDPETDRVYVSDVKAGTVWARDARTGAPVAEVKVGEIPHTVVVEPKSRRVYATVMGAGAVAVIDADSNAVVSSVKVGAVPHGLAVDAVHGRAYATNVKDNTVSVIDTKSLTVVATVPLPPVDDKAPWPWGVTVDVERRRVFVTGTGQLPTPPAGLQSSGSEAVWEIDATTDKVVRSFKVGLTPWNAAVDPASGDLFVGLVGTNSVAVVRDGEVVETIPVGQEPHGIVFDAKRQRVYVNASKANVVSVIDTKRTRRLADVAVGAQPQGIALDASGGRLFVANQGAASISVLAL